ncbi:MAG TPA: acetoin utilization protein AcuC [Actinomycetota bacterium]|nr:acetoin utilization protein AcuC [Actinomycetota bacterium]
MDGASRPFRPAAFVGHEIYREAAYGRLHPLMIRRVEVVVDLIRALDGFLPGEYVVSPRASVEELEWFHTADYIAALSTATRVGAVDLAIRERHAIGTMENPLFPGVFDRASTAVGGSIRAAELALEGRIAFHPAGGTHHGRPDRASGFCYFNDPVFAILRLLRAGVDPVLYVDLDAHHGDGVQDAFADDSRVHTISIHETGRWPWTGAFEDRGGGRALNLPVPKAFNDAELELLVDDVVLPLADCIAPEALVLTCGADALAGDPLASMALSNVALWDAIERLVGVAPRAVVLGGGGYNPWTLARYWTGLWARLSRRPVPEKLPEEASGVLRGLACDLIDDEDVDPRWITTLADAPAPARIRDDVRALRDAAMARTSELERA